MIKDSSCNRILAAPLCGLPFQEEPDTAFNPGSITFHSIQVQVNSRTLSELIINWDGTDGVIALPFNINTNAVVSNNNDFDFGIAARMAWVSKQERSPLVFGFNETIFQEIQLAGEKSVDPKAGEETIKMDVDMKGPTTFLVLQVQSESDVNAGNWTKCCDDQGRDYVKEFMLITSSTPR